MKQEKTLTSYDEKLASKKFNSVRVAASACGFGKYDSLALAAITAYGPAEATRLAKLAGIPQSKFFQVVENLRQRFPIMKTVTPKQNYKIGKRNVVNYSVLKTSTEWDSWAQRRTWNYKIAHTTLVEHVKK